MGNGHGSSTWVAWMKDSTVWTLNLSVRSSVASPDRNFTEE